MPVNYCTHCGAHLVTKHMGDRVRPVCPACGEVVYLNPLVAAAALVDYDGKVVLIKRKAEPKSGHWALPSGYVEADESADEAAIRETLEETGLHVAIDELLDVYSFHNATQGSGVLVLYSAHVVGGKLSPGDDASDARKFEAREIPDDIAFRTHRQALESWGLAKGISYRSATDADTAKVKALSSEAPEALATHSVCCPIDSVVTHLVAVRGEQVLGWCKSAVQDPPKTLSILQIHVLAPFRRWGIGTQLLKHALDYSQSLGGETIISQIPPSNPMLQVYLRVGFKVRGIFLPPITSDVDSDHSLLLLVREF